MSYIDYDGEDVLAELAKANRFTIQELEQNRLGKIAESQRMQLAGKALRPLYTSAMTFAGWILFLGLIWFFVPGFLLRIASMLFGQSLSVTYFAALMITLGCLGSLAVGFLKSGRRTIGLMFDLSKGEVATLEGRVWASRGKADSHGMAKLHGEENEDYHYVLNDQYFEVRSLYAFEALAPREQYRLYYTPNSKLLLSIEPVTGRATTQGASA